MKLCWIVILVAAACGRRAPSGGAPPADGAGPLDAALAPDACTAARGAMLGIQQQFPSDVGQFDALIAREQALGVGWVRMYWMWPWVEAVQGQPDFTAIRTAVDAAHARGLKIVVLATGAPPWANGGQAQDFPPDDAHVPDYAGYAAALATQVQPDAIELWNEPNNQGFWASGPDPAKLAHMQVAAYQAIKAARPSTIVVTGGLTQVAYQPQQFFADELAADPDFVHSFDAVALHPYNEPADPLQPGGYPNILTVQLPAIHDALVQQGRGDVPFWMTEYGVATSGQYSVSEADQATYLMHFFSGLDQLRSSGIAIGPAILSMLEDWSAYGSSGSEQPFFGLYRSDGSAKPSLAVVEAEAQAPAPCP